MEAYRDASGPGDFEKKVNALYDGSEAISVYIQDSGPKTQNVIGYFDNNEDGKVSEDEKVFSINRVLDGENANYAAQGYNSYSGFSRIGHVYGHGHGVYDGQRI